MRVCVRHSSISMSTYVSSVLRENYNFSKKFPNRYFLAVHSFYPLGASKIPLQSIADKHTAENPNRG